MITAVSVIKRLSLYEFTLWGRDLVSVVRIIEVFVKENMPEFCRELETVSVPRGSRTSALRAPLAAAAVSPFMSLLYSMLDM